MNRSGAGRAGVEIPAELATAYAHNGDLKLRAWSATLPRLAARYLDEWGLRQDGTPGHGAVAAVFPVRRVDDGTPAVLKLQPVDDETCGEPAALRAWNGSGAVRLLRSDPATGSMLLERLDASRSLDVVPDVEEALQILAELLARLVAVPAPSGLRHLGEIAGNMLGRVVGAVKLTTHQDDRDLIERCAGALREVAGEPGGQLLHWDLHYENVLASPPGSGREPWLAIDPKPLVGDPGFDLFPALWNRWSDAVATGDVTRAVRRRFDLMTGVLGLERPRAVAWTLGRVLQNSVWDAESGRTAMAPEHRAIAQSLLGS
ncbi:MAG TPA: aminoglycoside phosphotransferase family protein [Actinocrinis sp.]|jgi:streptomycin 6-kinase